MAEGWACYATELMEALGFLTPDEQIAEHHMRVRLMTRAVVDLELHTGRMTFDDAVRFHVTSGFLSPAAAHAEVTKCSMFPGTAMVPRRLGGVKTPSLLNVLNDARQASRSSGVAPHKSSSRTRCGARLAGASGKGCVRDATSPSTSLAGTSRSSIRNNGLPVSRSNRKR